VIAAREDVVIAEAVVSLLARTDRA
jgi:hypothetical protein